MFSKILRNSLRSLARICGVVCLVILFGCSTAQDYIHHHMHPSPTVSEFTVCHGYGCRLRKTVHMESSTWDEVANLFDPVPTSAAEERERLARAIGLLEVKIGATIGTTTDEAAAKTFGGEPEQLDCIDETVNTTTYLQLLVQKGLMRRHTIGIPDQRGWLLASFFGSTDFITNTAVIVDKDSGVRFAIDSYFYPNGRPPKIMPLTEWRKNWRPAPDDPLLQPLS